MSDFFNGDQVCLREMQAFHEMLDREKGFDRDMLRNVAYLAEEVGEVVSAIREVRDADGPSAEEAARAPGRRTGRLLGVPSQARQLWRPGLAGSLRQKDEPEPQPGLAQKACSN